MSYILTTRFIEDNESGSKILGIYTTMEEAYEVLNLYMKNINNEILTIEFISKNVKPSDLLKIEKSLSKWGEEIIKVDKVEYESQYDYIEATGLGSRSTYVLGG